MFSTKKISFLFLYLPLIACCLLLSSCNTIDLYEKVVPMPGQQWPSSFKPAFQFQIKDTAVPYQLYFIIRHNNQYKYNNVWVNLYAKGPTDSARKFSLELPLANKEGWLGSGMDDIFEHRIAFALDPQKFSFAKAGNYTFTLEQIMREDPLPYVLNAGIRIEKETTVTMAADTKRKLQMATVVYWVLLLYIIAALAWWAFLLLRQNNEIHQLKRETIVQSGLANELPIDAIEESRRRGVYKYIGEGTAFLLLICVGAMFIYRSVRRQFRLQQQQQNFVMAVTHELKTPIAVARLNLETLQRHQLDEERQKKLLQTTLQETLRLDTLINNILIASQLEDEAYRMTKEELDFSILAKDVVKSFEARYPERPVASSIQEEVTLNGDAVLLKLLLSNLLENANKYSPKGKGVALKLAAEEDKISLCITDEGTGIADEEKQAVFQKFYRIGSEQTRKTQGTGLGLYISQKIVQDHGGDILVKDNQPAGTKFIVQFYT